MLRFFHFYGPTLIRAIPMLWVAADRYVAGVGVMLSAIALFNPELSAILAFLDQGLALALPKELPEISRWWALAPLLTLFVYGFLRALQERFEGVEDQLATVRNRRAVKNLLGDAIEEGLNLKKLFYYESDELKVPTPEDVEDWVHRTYDLVEAAFDKGEARRFLNGEGYKQEGLEPHENLLYSRGTYSVGVRLWRLHQLIDRANSLEINPDFDRQSAAQYVTDATDRRLKLEAALEQRNEENERLGAENERVTAERDAFEQEGRQLKDELDGLLRRRCGELSDELNGFFKETRSEDPDGTMRLYKERFRDKIDPLRSELKKHGLWKPRKEVRERLEYPQTPDDLRSLNNYIRNIGVRAEF